MSFKSTYLNKTLNDKQKIKVTERPKQLRTLSSFDVTYSHLYLGHQERVFKSKDNELGQ